MDGIVLQSHSTAARDQTALVTKSAHLGVREQRSGCHRLPSVVPTWELELNKPFPGVAQMRCHPSFLRIGSSLFWTFTVLSYIRIIGSKLLPQVGILSGLGLLHCHILYSRVFVLKTGW